MRDKPIAVMVSCIPSMCDLMFKCGITVLVRSTRPELYNPFKCYVYRSRDERRVVGEFTCNRISGYGFRGHAWSVSHIRMYDNPVDINEFELYRLSKRGDHNISAPPQDWYYVVEKDEIV